jgi:hypothetical protein
MRETTVILFGAVSEILADTLDHQAHSGEAARNTYFTPDDFDHVRELADRVEKLREKADCGDFGTAAAKLLNDEAQRFSALASEIAKLLAPWRAADDAVQRSITELVAALGTELHALTRIRQTDLLSDTALEQVLRPYGIDGALRTVSPRSIETYVPNDARITTQLTALREKLATFVQVTQDLVARAHPLADSVKQRIAERRVLLIKGVADDDRANAIGRLDGRRKQFAFLKLSNPPSADHFECDDALTLFLNLAEDIGSGVIVPRNAAGLTRAYESFMVRFAEVDGMLSTAIGFEEQGRARVTALEQVVRRLHEELNPPRIRSAVDAFRESLANARKLLTRATQLAQSGEVAVAQALRDRVMASNDVALHADDVDRAITDQAAKMHALEQAFVELREEGDKQTSGWRGLIGGGVPFLNSHDVLSARLSAFHDLQASIGWGPGSELSGKLIRMIRDSLEFSEVAGAKPALRPWTILSDAVDRMQPKDVTSSSAFVNALCAMAAAHDALGDRERAAIHKAVVGNTLPIETSTVDEMIAGWRNIEARRPLLEAISQAIVDTDTIIKPEVRECLLRELQAVARADHDVGGLEVLVYRGFFARITRPLHAEGGDVLQ